jgi:beta-lactamase superfamily II metal-dependent hydrolase
LPQVYRDERAFDRRAYLAQQGIDLVGALRAPELLELVAPSRSSVPTWMPRLRQHLRKEIDTLWPSDANVGGILRAMLLGDRHFGDREEAADFQKAGAFHVLVVAGLHVGAIAVVLFWLGRKLRWARAWTVLFTLLLLLAYVGVVQQRAPVLRATLMAAIVVAGGFFFRRLDLLNSAALATVSPYLWSRGFQKIDVVALTHAHQDPLGGLTAIVENFRVGSLWIGREVNSPAVAKLESLATERHIPIEYESPGKAFSLDGVDGQFLWPDLSNVGAAPAAKNNDSLVLRLKYRNRTLLLPGDAEKQAEHAMLAEASGTELRADVLKVGHHGSKNSTSQEFLDAVDQKIAIYFSWGR